MKRAALRFLSMSILYLVLCFPMGPLQAQSKVEQAVHVLVSLCVSGGTVKVSRSNYDSSGNSYQLESTKGSFSVESREVSGFVNGLDTAISQLSSEQANRARDCMNPYIKQVLAMIEPVPGQTVAPPPNQQLLGIPVNYYFKTSDGRRVSNALRSRGISFSLLNSVLPDSLPTNAIECGQNTPPGAIKELALTLTDAGIPVRLITRIQSNAQNVLYVLAYRNKQDETLHSEPLTRAQIDRIEGCPPAFDQPLANVKRFQNPHPTGRQDDGRYVDAWLKPDQTRGAADAAGQFCIQRGYAGAFDYKAQLVDTGSSVAIHLGDNSACQGQCFVFQSITCD